MSPTTRRLAGVLAVATLALAACGESAADNSSGTGDDVLVFASIPTEESTSLKADFQPVLDMLEKETGKQIEFQQATDYAAIIEGQRAGKIDIAQYGAFSYVRARSSGVRTSAVASQVEEKGEQPGYRSYGIVQSGSRITGLDGFRGKKVCFVDPSSTSGYLYPRAGLLEAGIDPESDITPVMAGGHDASALSVASGQCDAGFAYDTMVDSQLIEKGQLKKGRLTTVWKSELIAGPPIAVSDDLDAGLRKTIAEAVQQKANADYLRANGYCGQDCPVGDSGGWGFVKVDDSFFDGVRKVCDITKDKQCTAS